MLHHNSSFSKAGLGGSPSVVAVTSQVPWPLDSGGHLRTFHLLRALARTADVRLVVPTPEDRIGASVSALQTAGITPSVVPVPKRTMAGESVTALRAAIDQEPYVLFARHRRPVVQQALMKEVAGHAPAVLYLDHLDSLVYADACPSSAVVIDMHNVYSRLASRMAGESGAFRRRYLERESALLAKMEQRAVEVAHTVLAVSAEEAEYFRQLGAKRVVVVPNGVDCEAFDHMPIGDREGPPTILFVGTLAWPPNATAARFLATEVMPAVRRRFASARLLIVGRDPGPDVLALARPGSGVEVIANVKDVAPYYREAHVLAVTLQSGGGTRLKILEAFAAGVPVVSTTIGCEGIAAVPGSHLSVADGADFAPAVIAMLERPDRARVLAVRARSLARQRYDWPVVGRRASEAVMEAAVTNGFALRGRPASAGPWITAP